MGSSKGGLILCLYFWNFLSWGTWNYFPQVWFREHLNGLVWCHIPKYPFFFKMLQCLELKSWGFSFHLMGPFPLEPFRSFFYGSLHCWIKHSGQRVFYWSNLEQTSQHLETPAFVLVSVHPTLVPCYPQTNLSSLAK